MVKIGLKFNKIGFKPYSKTLSKKYRPPKKPKAVKDRGGGSRVGMTAVKYYKFFFNASLILCIKTIHYLQKKIPTTFIQKIHNKWILRDLFLP